MKQIKLYTTAGCHLCEQAELMLKHLIEHDVKIAEQFCWVSIDIANDESLVEQFGIRIPVLVKDMKEIGWPFEIFELREWLICE